LEGRSLGRSDAGGLEAILADPELRERLGELTVPSLQPLLGDPAVRQLDLLRTLAAYLDRNGSWEAAARDLGVHRHTLRSRMAKVGELTGLNPDLAHDRVFLTLALATLDAKQYGELGKG
jgi:purine catabolism regulator